ncbi:hypothetical protein Actkin_04312 [Actinokineospora sp. UTMC 2448]|nr:hypothetical protein Actkin_04312 [Actinokineospora sp. UTMC 2448]
MVSGVLNLCLPRPARLVRQWRRGWKSHACTSHPGQDRQPTVATGGHPAKPCKWSVSRTRVRLSSGQLALHYNLVVASLPRRLGGSRRDQLLLHQAHALDHYEDSLRLRSPLYLISQPSQCRGFPNPLRRDTVTCPICGRPTSLDQLSEDHAPQQGQQSSLGSPTAIVLTCRRCNNESKFENEASQIRRFDELEANDLACAVHGSRRVDHRSNGLYVVADETALVLSDVKSAFLLAFASLGYKWALAKELDEIRAALTSSDLPDRDHVWQGVIEMGDAPPGNTVLEVAAPNACTIVRAANRKSVVLPAPGHSRVPLPNQLGQLQVRTHPWPYLLGPGRLVDQQYQAGRLFHVDFCKEIHWSTST